MSESRQESPPQNNTVRIRNVELIAEVNGEGDEAVFARFFEKYIKRWDSKEAEMKTRQCRLEANRALLNRSKREYEV